MKGSRRFHRARCASRVLPRRISAVRVVRRFACDTNGATVTLVALLSPVLIGGMGLGAETGYWYFTQRALQHAADVSAHAAGIRNRAGDSEEEMEAAALHIAAQAGFTPDNSTLTLEWPPVTGPNAGDTDAVEVVLSRTMPRLLSSIFHNAPVTATARAVAFVQLGTQACVLALNPSASRALEISGGANLAIENCDAASDSLASDGFYVGGTASLSARCASTVGGALTSANVTLSECEEVREYAPVVADPYRFVADPTIPASCDRTNRNLGNPSTSTTITPGPAMVSGMPVYHFCNGVSIMGNVTFQPGLYIVSGGDFDATAAANVQGTGVTFYITSPNKVNLNGIAELNLSAPTSGELSGILFFGSRDATNIAHKVNGTSTSNLQGALYFPTTAVEYSGSSAISGGCTQVIGDTVLFTGNASLSSDCAAAGTEDIMVNEAVALVE
jgi:hypothetical protein